MVRQLGQSMERSTTKNAPNAKSRRTTHLSRATPRSAASARGSGHHQWRHVPLPHADPLCAAA
jgi:hypothetical protein